MNKQYSVLILYSFFVLLLASAGLRSYGQCSNWSIAAPVTTSATCAANGTFATVLNGPDVLNLSNVQYGMPISASGFSVPLNTSPGFAGIPPGIYQVSAVATCGGAIVGRTTTVTIPGSYIAPTISNTSTRGSLNCGATGWLSVNVSNGVLPITYNLITHPAAYSGPLSLTLNRRSCSFINLPPGAYAVQVVDACSTGAIPKPDTVRSLNPTTAQYIAWSQEAKGCDSLIIHVPYINEYWGGWTGYGSDTSFKCSIQISGGIASASPFLRMPDSFIAVKLAATQTLKSCYGKTITYTVKPPCGPNSSFSQPIPYPTLVSVITQHCNTDFTAELRLSSIVCFPVTYTLYNIATAQNYGPYTAATNSVSTPNLPLGFYTVTFTTGDGYTSVGGISTSAATGNPYSVSVLNGSIGLNNYIDGFQFTTSTSSVGGTKLVELFSSPAGYTYQGYWNSAQPYKVLSNGFPSPTTLKFPAGTYVWKMTDNCGVYYLSITVPSSALYQFIVGAPAQRLTCQGLWITPTGSAANAGSAVPVGYSILRNGMPLMINTGSVYTWPVYPSGTAILLTQPGTYTILPTASFYTINLSGYYNPGGFGLSYPNSYTSSYTFTYSQQPLSVDMNTTQGFLCKGAAAGNGQIWAKGKDGIPFYAPPSPHYNYYLALPGNAVGGPYIATNTSGVFSGFGGAAGAFYDVKVEDTCGAFAVQRVRILDLSTTRLISSSDYVACAGDNVQLSAIYLPNASYSWTGPNGFSSTLRQPTIAGIGPLNIGVYRVTITTAQCGTPVTDSTIVTVAGNPPKPLISYQCNPLPIAITVTNPSAGLSYGWAYGYPYATPAGIVYLHGSPTPSDTLYTMYAYGAGSYAAVAIDTLTGCATKSDSLLLNTDPWDTVKATIYAPHLQLCTGDTATLVAGGYGNGIAVRFQWLRNGTPISSATGGTFITALAGSYRVVIDGGLCNVDTSAAAVVTIVAPPSASITASSLSICAGDTAALQATASANYSYTWHYNGSTIPGAFASTYKAAAAGSYTVTVSNGACVAVAAPVSIIVNQPPVASLTPSGAQAICAGTSLTLSTLAGAGWSYSWKRNGVALSGAASGSYTTSTAGSYQVIVSASGCPPVASAPVTVQVLPTGVNIGPDTTNCGSPGTLLLLLSVDTGFTQILWSTGAQKPSILASAAGVYWVKAINQCGTFTDTMRLYDFSEYVPRLPNDTMICNASSGGRLSVPLLLKDIRWNTGATTASILIDTPGTYWVAGQSPCGPVRDTVAVHFCAPEIIGIQLSADSICEGSCVSVYATVQKYPARYSWHFEGGNPQASSLAAPGSVCYSTAGVYPLTLIVSNRGGTDTAESYVVVLPKPTPRFKDTFITVSYKSLLQMPACAAAQHADWYLDDSLVCADCPSLPLQARYYRSVYRCIVRNGDCPDSCSYALRVIDIPNDLWLPDAFTPNGDGRNDFFQVITDNPNIQVVNLDVYNRWGQRVFTSNLNNYGWDGTLHGPPADGGVYFWQLRYRVWDGKDEIFYKKGDVLLIR